MLMIGGLLSHFELSVNRFPSTQVRICVPMLKIRKEYHHKSFRKAVFPDFEKVPLRSPFVDAHTRFTLSQSMITPKESAHYS